MTGRRRLTISNQDEYLGKNIIDEQLKTKEHKYLKRFKLNAKQKLEQALYVIQVQFLVLSHQGTFHQY